MRSSRAHQRATALTWARGCDQSNDCWDDCYEFALDDVRSGELEDWDRQYATVKQYRKYTGKRLGSAETEDRG